MFLYLTVAVGFYVPKIPLDSIYLGPLKHKFDKNLSIKKRQMIQNKSKKMHFSATIYIKYLFVGMMPKRVHISVNDKILILLSSFSHYKNDWEIPFTLTQQGIADYLSLARCNVSRAMKKMEEEGIIEGKKAHIKGINRKRLVYFPTTNGLIRIQEINEELDKIKLPFKGEDGEIKELSIDDISKILDNRFSFLELYEFYSKNEFIDISIIKREEEKLVDFTEKAPNLDYFYGRKKEKAKIDGWVGKYPIIILRGIAGIGKTTLAAKVVEEYRPRTNILWFRLHEWTTLRYLLNQTASFLDELGVTTLSNYLEGTNSLNLENICNIRDIIMDSLRSVNALIVVDDAHKAEEKVNEFINLLILGINSAFTRTNLKFCFLFTTRNKLPIMDTLQMKKSKRAKEIVLDGLDEKSSYMLLQRRIEDEKELEKVYKLTNGHPLAMELIEEVTEAMEKKEAQRSEEAEHVASFKDLNKFIYEEIFQKLTADERKMLDSLSVYRYPILKSWVLNKRDKPILTVLQDKSLITENNQRYIIHDIVKSFFYFRLSGKEMTDYHKVAGYRYLKETKYRFNIDLYNEVLFHFQKSGDNEFVSSFIITNGEDFISKGYTEELSRILRSLEEEKVPEKDWGKILYLKAKVLEVTGEPSSAQDYLKYTISVCKNNKDLITLAKSYNLLGWIKAMQGDWDAALDSYSLTKETLSKRGVVGKDSKNSFIKERLTARLYRDIGFIHWRNGEWPEAKKNWDVALKHANKIQDRPIIGEILVDMGNLYKDQGDWDLGLKKYLEALEIWEEMDEKQRLMRVYLNLGAINVHMENYCEAIDWLNKDHDLAKNIGSTKSAAWAAFNLAEAYAKSNDFESAQQYCEEALAIAERLNDPLAISYSYRVYGIIYRHQGEWLKSENFFKQSVSILEELRAKYHMAEAYLEFGQMYRNKGDKKEAKDYLRRSQALFKELGNKTYVKKIDSVLKCL